MSKKAKILLIDDHPLVREWLANLINQQPDLEVCGEAGNRGEALSLMGSAEVDIAVVDISLEGSSGLELIKDLKALHRNVIVVVLSMHDESLYAERALRAGARGYVMKREATKKVLLALRSVLGGGLYLSEKMANLMAERWVHGAPAPPANPMEKLSDRELEVFELLGRGCGTRQMAEALKVSFKTVQAFRERIKDKLGLGNATELLREAMRWHDSKESR